MSKSSPAESDDPIGRLLSRLVAIAAILGIPAGLYGYFSAEHAKRVEKSFGLYDDFRSESFQKSWAVWPAPGSEDTELGVLMEPEVGHGEASVYA